jgi:protoporphyrinogen oxidase
VSGTVILGGGMTGLSAGLAAGCPVYEQAEHPGGICASYYMRPGEHARLPTAPSDGGAYRFELGGGHWIFGGDPTVLRFIDRLTPVRTYTRRAAVYFSKQKLFVPYPLQNHLGHLAPDLAARAVDEILRAPAEVHPPTMADWIVHHFGPTLTELFFGPFHARYTAGLWMEIAPQDAYKSPLDRRHVADGVKRGTAAVGYNTTFVYPDRGLDALAQGMAAGCGIAYGRRVVRLDPVRRRIELSDGTATPYGSVLATLPLNRLMQLSGLSVDAEPDPSTAVLVLNIGATKGPSCPAEHWLYVPDSDAGFFRVGFYSNVNAAFLPGQERERQDRVSIYVERAYRDGQRPDAAETDRYAAAVVEELRAWGFIDRAEVVDPTWIDVAYTWARPRSAWRTLALRRLEEAGIYPVGRYGRWIFQGIADSIRDGFSAGAAFKEAR